MPERLVLRAHAKLNLALAVGPPQPPRGYHPIASLMVAIDLADALELRRLPPGAPSTHHLAWDPAAPRPSPIDWPIEKDLAVRAHRLLEDRLGRPLPTSLVLRKSVPVGGGLGGGSADAAAMLRGLVALHHLEIPPADLARWSAALGSDVAFFLDDARPPGEPPRAAVVSGFGDAVRRVPGAGAGWPAILLLPPFGTPTGPVYAAYDAAPRPLRGAEIDALAADAADPGADPAQVSRGLFNDLAAPASAVQPPLGQLLAAFAASPTPVHLTGSGSTLFALGQPTELDAVAAAAAARGLTTVPARLMA